MLTFFLLPCYGRLSSNSHAPKVPMPRILRLLVSETPSVYYVTSRTTLAGIPFGMSFFDIDAKPLLYFL